MTPIRFTRVNAEADLPPRPVGSAERRLGILVCGVLAACVFTALALGERVRDKPKAASDSNVDSSIKTMAKPAAEPPAPIIQSKKAPAVVPGLAVFLTSHGFEPSQITAPARRFALAVIPQTGQSNLSFSLDRLVGGHIRNAPIRKEEPLWADVHDLIPGRYILSEASNPQWTCEIIVR